MIRKTAGSEYVVNIERKNNELKELKKSLEGIDSRIEQVESEILDDIDAFLESRRIQRILRAEE